MNGADWAQRVGAHEPHGLVEVEAQVLNGAQYTLWRASRDRGSKKGEGVLLAVIFSAGVLGALAGATVFLNRENALYLSYNFGTEFGLVAAAIGFVFGFVLQFVMLIEWFREGRLRSIFGAVFSLGMLVCASLTLWLGYREVGGDVTAAMPYLLPALLTAGASLLLIIGRLAGHARQSVTALQPGVEVKHIPPRNKQALLADRRQALHTLADRNMLTAGEPEDLAQRPLGLLAEPVTGSNRNETDRARSVEPEQRANTTGRAGTDQGAGVDDGTFCFDVDGFVVLKGRGSAATGKVATGSVTVGADIVAMRDGVEVVRSRVLGVDLHRKEGEVARAGDKAVLLLEDIPRGTVRDGDQIVAVPATS